jgi:hypothetical protein
MFPRVTHPSATPYCYGVRLACVRPAASVRSEPGSNSQVELRFYPDWSLSTLLTSSKHCVHISRRKHDVLRKRDRQLSHTASPIKGTPARTYRRPRLSFFRFNCQTATTNPTPKPGPPNTALHNQQNRNRPDHSANKAEQSDLVRPVKLDEAEFRQPVQTGRAVGVRGLCRHRSQLSTREFEKTFALLSYLTSSY